MNFSSSDFQEIEELTNERTVSCFIGGGGGGGENP